MKLLGAKGQFTTSPLCDFIIDLHSSNSDVGLVAMISAGEKDITAMRLAAHLLRKFPQLKVTISPGGKDSSPNVDSITYSGIAFEVGPIPHGTLKSDLLEATRCLVLETLSFFDDRNCSLLCEANITTPLGKDNHKQLPDIITIQQAPLQIRKQSPFPSIEVFQSVKAIEYPPPVLPPPPFLSPRPEEEVIGTDDRISTPTVSAAAATAVIHPSLEGPNWKIIKDGDPLFVSTDGSMITTHTFTHPKPAAVQHGQTDMDLFTMFVNEAAYQEKNIAFAVYEKLSKSVY